MSDHRPESSMGDLLERLISEAEQAGSQGKEEPKVVSNTEQTMGDHVSSGIFSNPALLSALPQLLQGLGALSAGKASTESKAASAHATAEEAVESRKNTPVKAIPQDRHTALLCALKPYLSPERRRAAESLINLCRVWSMLQGMGIDLPSLLLPTKAEARSDLDKEV